MQQTQEKQQQKLSPNTTTNHQQQQIDAYRPSPVPTILSVTAKVCYGLSAASIATSLLVWNRVQAANARPAKNQKAQPKQAKQPSERQYHEAQRLGTFVGLWSPTLAVVGKILDDASERFAQYDFARWEKKQAEKVQSVAFRTRFFNR
jgi:hypothetical protein